MSDWNVTEEISLVLPLLYYYYYHIIIIVVIVIIIIIIVADSEDSLSYIIFPVIITADDVSGQIDFAPSLIGWVTQLWHQFTIRLGTAATNSQGL